MYDIITIGAIKLDTFIQIEKAYVDCKEKKSESQLLSIPYGQKNTVGNVDLQIAGSAPNVAIGITKLRGKSAVYSEMGKDIIHTMAINFLKKQKVDTRYIQASTEQKSSFAAVLNYKGESTQLVAHDGNNYRLPKKMPRTRWIHLSEQGSGYEKLYKDIIALVKSKGVLVSFNPGTVQIKESRDEFFKLLKQTEVLFVNRVEAERILKLKKGKNIQEMLIGLYQLGPKQIVITDGRQGAYAYDGVNMFFAPMFPGDRVEATGAGDSFSTGYLGAIMHQKNIDEALAWGSINAASVVQYIGPVDGLLGVRKIQEFMRENPEYQVQLI